MQIPGTRVDQNDLPITTNQHTEKDQNDPFHPTADRLATEYKVSAPTITRDGQYAAAVDTLKAVKRLPPWRRNLHPDQASYLRGKRYNSEKQQGKRTDLETSNQNDKKSQTHERLAEEYKVSPATITRDGQYAAAVVFQDETRAGDSGFVDVWTLRIKLIFFNLIFSITAMLSLWIHHRVSHGFLTAA